MHKNHAFVLCYVLVALLRKHSVPHSEHPACAHCFYSNIIHTQVQGKRAAFWRQKVKFASESIILDFSLLFANFICCFAIFIIIAPLFDTRAGLAVV